MSLPTHATSGSASASASQPSQSQPAMTFAEFFQDAFVRSRGTPQAPYAYQCRLAGGPNAAPDGAFNHGTECRSQLISIPTGLGKTAGVVLAVPQTDALVRSMSRQAICRDNTDIEFLSTTRKRTLVHRTRFPAHADARVEISHDIARFYNSHRLHSALGHLSPTEFGQHS